MPTTRADQKVLGYLGRALSLELSAVQLYSAQSRLVATWGLEEPAERLRNEAHEEVGHAERIIARMLALGVSPGASQLRPVRLSTGLRELLVYDQSFENELVKLYRDASHHSARIGSQDDVLFFKKLLEEEQGHAEELAGWIDQLDQPLENATARGGGGR